MAADGDRSARALAQAIAEGTPVDWAEAEATAESESARATVRQLRVIAGIAELHQRLPREPDIEPQPPLSADSPPQSGPDAGVAAIRARAAGDALGSWGPLTLLERVARGSFGDVYRAWDPRLDREVALKVFEQPEWPRGRSASIAVEEGRLLARVHHPNVVTVYGADRLGESVGVWTEFVHGRTLEELVAERGPLGAGEAAAIGVDVCRALAAVHRAGLLHRDVKAQNVMREDGGRIVLMDFGTGIGLDEAADAGRPGAGTPLYMAPEIFEGCVPTPRADLYSVGVLLYHLVSGTYPVLGRDVRDIRAAHRFGPRHPLGTARPDLPAPFVDTVERALARDPAARYENATAMESALAAVLARNDAHLENASPKAAAGLRPRRWAAVTLAASAVILMSMPVAFRVVQGRWPGGTKVASRSDGTGAVAAPGPVQSLRGEGKDVMAVDRQGRTVWQYRYDQPVFPPASWVVNTRLPGIDVILGLDQQGQQFKGQLDAFSSAGHRVWSYTHTGEVEFAAGRYGPPWGDTGVAVFGTPGHRRIAWAVHHHTWWPSVLLVLDERGQVTDQFVNAGWITKVGVTRDDRYLVAAGISQEHDAWMLAVLDAAHPGGSAPADRDRAFACRNCPPGRPVKYFVLPHMELFALGEGGVVFPTIHVFDDGGFELRIPAGPATLPSAEVIYEFSRDLTLAHASASEVSWQWHREFESRGALTHSADRCPERGGFPAREWTPQGGWRDIRVPARR